MECNPYAWPEFWGNMDSSCERRHFVDQLEPRMGGTLRRVFVRDGKAKTCQQPLLVALQHCAVELAYRQFAGLLIGPQDLRLILGLQVQIVLGFEKIATADEHGYLTALGPANTVRRLRCIRRCR